MGSPDSAISELHVRQVFGIGEVLWAVLYRRWRKRAQDWPTVPGRIEAREFLRFATNAGWLNVSYSYTFQGAAFSGEFRKWILSKKTSKAESDPETIGLCRRFPLGPQITVRVNPLQLSRSVVDHEDC